MANRFETPVATPMNVEFFTPNMELWAQTLAGQQQRYNTWLSERTKLPEYDARADQSVFDEFMTGSQEDVDRIASAYTDDVLAGNKTMRDALLQVNRDWNPGGTAYNLAQRTAAFQQYTDALTEDYSDATVRNYLIDRMYKNPRNAFYNEDGTFQMPVPTGGPQEYTDEKVLEVTSDIIGEIKDKIFLDENGNVKPQYKNIMNKGFTSVYEMRKYLKGTDLNEALEILGNRMPRDMVLYGQLKQDAYGMDIPEDANRDDLMVTVEDENGKKRRVINPFHPYAREAMGAADSIDGVKEAPMSTFTINDDRAKANYEYSLNNSATPLINPMGSTNGDRRGILGQGANASNYTSRVDGLNKSYRDQLLIDAGGDQVVADRIDKAIADGTSMSRLQEMFPNVNIGRVVSMKQNAMDAQLQAERLSEKRQTAIRNALGEEKYAEYERRNITLSNNILELRANDPTGILDQFTDDQLKTIERVFIPGNMGQGGQDYYLIDGVRIPSTNMEAYQVAKSLDNLYSEQTENWQEAERIGDNQVNNDLNTATAFQDYGSEYPVVMNSETGAYDSRLTAQVQDQLESYTSDPTRFLDAAVRYGRTGEFVNIGELLPELIRNQTGDEIDISKITGFYYQGGTMTVDEFGQRSLEWDVDVEVVGKLENIRIPMEKQIEDLYKYGQSEYDIRQEINNGNLRAADKYVDINAKDYADQYIRKASTHGDTYAYYPGSARIFGRVYINNDPSGEAITGPDGNSTGEYRHYEILDGTNTGTIKTESQFRAEVEKMIQAQYFPNN